MADWGDVAGAFVLGGIAGGADKYTQLQDEHRKYQHEEALKEAEFTRQKALAEFGVQLKTNSTVVGQKADGSIVTNEMIQSGAVNPGEFSTERDMKWEDAKSGQLLNGRELTNREVKSLTPEQQEQLKSPDQHVLDMHEAQKKIDAKYREPRADAVGNAMELYKRKDAFDREQIEAAHKSGEITDDEYAVLKKKSLGLTSQGGSDKVLKGVERLRTNLEELDTSGLDEWESNSTQAKVFLKSYKGLTEKEKAQADKIYPGMAEQATVIAGVDRLAEMATAAGDKNTVTEQFGKEFFKSRGITSDTDKKSQRFLEAVNQLKQINETFDSVYSKKVNEAPMWKLWESDTATYERNR